MKRNLIKLIYFVCSAAGVLADEAGVQALKECCFLACQFVIGAFVFMVLGWSKRVF